jgi:phospholipase/carboxylesterase
MMTHVCALSFSERPAAVDPSGLLILHHGRGANERDLLELADVLDPGRALHIVAPRAPLTIPGWPGYHWYVAPRVGYPDPETFTAAYSQLGEFHDAVWTRTAIAPERTVLGGFSMGTVMSYALGLGADRPAPAGILALSGFIPTVAAWRPDIATRAGLPVFIGHGRSDRVIDIGFAHTARAQLEAGGARVDYHEADGGHQIEPTIALAAREWLAATLMEADA